MYTIGSRMHSHTRSTADVVQSKLGDARVELHEHGERLADTAGGTENGDLGVLHINWLVGCISMRIEHELGHVTMSRVLNAPLLDHDDVCFDSLTSRAEAEKARRWATLKARLAANIVTV